MATNIKSCKNAEIIMESRNAKSRNTMPKNAEFKNSESKNAESKNVESKTAEYKHAESEMRSRRRLNQTLFSISRVSTEVKVFFSATYSSGKKGPMC